MEELIPIHDHEGENVVNARELHAFLGSKQDFSTWIKSRISKYKFVEGEDYLLHKIMEQTPTGAKHKIEYAITIDMAKDLGMVENNQKGKQVRDYFKDVEKSFKESTKKGLIVPNFDNPAEAARAWADQYEATKAAEQKAQIEQTAREKAEKTIEEQRPYVDMAKRVFSQKNRITLSETAKLLGNKLGRNKLIKRMKAEGLLMKHSGSEPYQEHVNKGYFVYGFDKKSNNKHLQCLVTYKGLIFLDKQLGINLHQQTELFNGKSKGGAS